MTSTLAAPPVSTRPSLRAAALTTFVLLVLAQVGIVAFTLWEPPFDGTIRYDDIEPIRTAYWPMNVLLGGPSYAVATVAASVFLAVLGAGRGNAVALVGIVLHLLGGLVFALVITAEVLPFAWATDPEVVDDAQGRALFESYNDRFDAFVPYILVSMAVVALGALLAITGAGLSGGLPWWVLGAAVAVAVLAFAVPPGGALAWIGLLAQRALWVYVGWRGLRSVLARG